MKFIVSSTELLSHLQAICRVKDSKTGLSFLDNFLFHLEGSHFRRTNTCAFHFNERFIDYNFLLKISSPHNQELRISKYEKEKERSYFQHRIKFENADSYFVKEDDRFTRLLDFKPFLSGSIRQLIRQLALYTELLQFTLFRVLLNTRIHSLSIFFGLCCSCSGYIFEAISGTSSYPVPVFAKALN